LFILLRKYSENKCNPLNQKEPERLV
jgi:hypothetical protein